ncbi:hypothetical protein SY83_02700 [Paenibacillus swuensis]|uniref:Glycosyl transferase family 1 n=1 Tax=Paenibacillus swuensis TaxID=1178515 RepID=A0A172TEN0_9BACL|nr:glycosyltransferase family 4 protein [Paenibacillus swuensis]ANE45412.1 hypothetical protein SY83_02700 [Paenibacillus swuensis]
MRKAKILQVCAIDVSTDALLKPMVLKSMEAGFKVHNACNDTGKFAALRQEGLEMREIPFERKIFSLLNIKATYQLYKLIRKERYEVVHVHTPVAAVLGRIASKLAGVRHILYTAHGFYFHEGMSKSTYTFFFQLEKWMARFCTNWLLLQSEEDYELCKRSRFMREERIIHLSNGVDLFGKFNRALVDPEAQKELRAELRIEPGDIVITFIGRLVREKGIFEITEAFKRLYEHNPRVKLILIGELFKGEPDQESIHLLREQMEHPGIMPVGYRKDIVEIMSVSDIFTLPSYREGLPRSIIEAMAMELPVVATNIRGCREEVFNGMNGYLVEARNADALYEKLHLLTEDKDMRIRYGKKGREIAVERFNEQEVIRKQLSLFNSLTKESS